MFSLRRPTTLAGALVTAVLLIAMALPALANSFTYSYTMDLRLVNGKANGFTYTLAAGRATHVATVWAYSKDPGANASPMQINVELRRVDLLGDLVVCTAKVTPSSTLNVKKSVTKDCGTIIQDDYYIFAWKTNDDGWNIKGTGTVTSPS